MVNLNFSDKSLFEVKKEVEKLFRDAKIANPTLEVVCIVEKVTGLSKAQIVGEGGKKISGIENNELVKLIANRLSGYPLQYILGEWDFLGLNLKIGEGVLIPRPETELLCEKVADFVTEKFANKTGTIKMLDLCAGSGCIGLGVASLCDKLSFETTALEFSAQAFKYLKANCEKYPKFNVACIRGDIFHVWDEKLAADKAGCNYDIIVCNPPYLTKGQMGLLDLSVLHEPETALDGGADGLDFYRVISKRWMQKLNKGGLCAVEVGIGQADRVVELFLQTVDCEISKVEIVPDYNGIGRIVIAYA